EGPGARQSLQTYRKPVVHPAPVVVELYAGKLGTSSLVLEHRLRTLADPPGTYGEGHCKLVWVRHAENRSTPVPDSIRAAIA
ncbi:acyl-CoA thioesterase, partial [Pseudomonas aeruginosa]